jgi:hypothetical protein
MRTDMPEGSTGIYVLTVDVTSYGASALEIEEDISHKLRDLSVNACVEDVSITFADD